MSRLIFCKYRFSRFHGTKPAASTLPPVGQSKPESSFSVVVLPAPLGPITPSISPSRIEKLMLSTAFTSINPGLNRLVKAAPKPPFRTGTRYTFVNSSATICGI
ncbi:hypothetical protein D3C75_701710 [compost metagenome]